MAGERGRDDGHDYQTYPPYAYGGSGWEPESGYAGAESPASTGYLPPAQSADPPYPPAGSPPSWDPYPPREAAQPWDSYPPREQPPPWDPRRPDDAYPPAGPRDGYPPSGWDGYPPAGRDGYPATDGAGYRADGHRVDGRPGRRKRRGLPLWQELPLLLVIAFCLAVLVRTFLLQAFYIPSGSMEDTLIAGDRVLVNKVVYNFRDPARGEVVVFQGTDSWARVGTGDGDIGMFAKVGRTLGDLVGISRPGEKDFIKRVVGLPGDTVSCCDVDGRVFVNGQPLNETYVVRDSPLDDGPPGGAQDCRSRRFDEVVVQPGNLFVMGDHRQVSQDSRCQGQVPIDNVIGRAFLIVWPNDRWASLPAPDTFDTVPQPAAAGGGVRVSPADPANLAFVLPFLPPVGRTFRAESARSRLIGRETGRRLAE